MSEPITYEREGMMDAIVEVLEKNLAPGDFVVSRRLSGEAKDGGEEKKA